MRTEFLRQFLRINFTVRWDKGMALLVVLTVNGFDLAIPQRGFYAIFNKGSRLFDYIYSPQALGEFAYYLLV